MGKSDLADFDELLTETAREHIASGVGRKVASNQIGDASALYLFPGQKRPPKWAGHLSPFFTIGTDIFVQSPCAILAFKKDDTTFAITFSYGHAYMDNRKTEADFGLKVAINFVSDERLRSIERANIGAAIRDVAQASSQSDFRSFGVDEALDLVRRVSGYSGGDGFADQVSGARALRFSKEIDLVDLPATAMEAKTLYASNAYKDTSFKIVDFLAQVLDPTIVEQLDELLLQSVKGTEDEFEIALPAIFPDKPISFRFERARINKFYPDLSLSLYRDELDARLADLDVEGLKHHRVAVYDEDGDKSLDYWSVHAALVGSVVHDGYRYALNEGLWYRIDDALRLSADQTFNDLLSPSDPNLRTMRKIYPPGGRSTGKATYQTEESYNSEISNECGYLLLDQRLVRINDVPGQGMEACDLLDLANRRLIHVKKSSRRSSVLSHFFKQGANSARMLKSYQAFRDRLAAIVEQHYDKSTADEVASVPQADWTIEFQIADFPRANGTHNIPFFSKLSLGDEVRRIRALGFSVKLGFITLPSRM